MPELNQQKVVVVGGSAGIGQAIASLAAEKGAEVVIGSRSAEKVARAAAAIGAVGDTVDTMNEASVQAFFERTGPMDHLVITASVVSFGSLRDLPASEVVGILHSKFLGPYLCARHAQMRSRGSLTFFSGSLSRRPELHTSVLSATNAAVEALGRALALELAPIRVNTIAPGLVRDTEAFGDMPRVDQEKMFTQASDRLPTRRVGLPRDIAEATLAVMTNGFQTGATIDVDGGALLI